MHTMSKSYYLTRCYITFDRIYDELSDELEENRLEKSKIERELSATKDDSQQLNQQVSKESETAIEY